MAEKWLNWTRMWRKSGYFGNFVATQFFDFGGKVAIFGDKVADFERKILATLDFKCVSSVVSIIERAYCVCSVTFKKEAFWIAEINSSFLNFVNFSHCLQSF